MPAKNNPKKTVVEEPEELSIEEVRTELQQKLKNIPIMKARIAFRNFIGRAGKYNAEGRRNFCVFLDKKDAEVLADDGWNIKVLKPRNLEDEEQAYIQVSVSFVMRPPKIVVISSGNRILLDEESIPMLDWAEIENVDLTIRPYVWVVNGKIGIKAYLKNMYVTLVADPIESKYENIIDHREEGD